MCYATLFVKAVSCCRLPTDLDGSCGCRGMTGSCRGAPRLALSWRACSSTGGLVQAHRRAAGEGLFSAGCDTFGVVTDIRNCADCFKDGVTSESCAPASGCSTLALCCLENPCGLLKVEKEVSHLEQFQWVLPSAREAKPLHPGNSPPAVPLQRQNDIPTPRGWCLRWSQG